MKPFEALQRWLQRSQAAPQPSQPDWSPVVVQPPYEDRVEQFMADTAQEFGLSPANLWRSGASVYLDGSPRGKSLRLACNGAVVSITVPLWPNLSSYRAGISWAPRDSHMRAKLTEEPVTIGLTGNREFDDLYLVAGDDASVLASSLPSPVQRLLAEHADMIIALGDVHFDPWLQQWSREQHMRADLILHTPEGYRPGGVHIGEQRFTPSYAAACLLRVAELVLALEPFEPQQLGPAV